jgi:cystathionine beta-synthase
MRVAENLLELIGQTPMVALSRINPVKGVRLLAKLEYFNPGGSVKDRIGISMIEAAERDGKLKPGGWIVEPTSGNTGVGLCIAAILKGYRVVFTMPDKVSPEKIDLLKAYGAEVVICPTAVAPRRPAKLLLCSETDRQGAPGGLAQPIRELSEP